jgi:hypothetical protein
LRALAPVESSIMVNDRLPKIVAGSAALAAFAR